MAGRRDGGEMGCGCVHRDDGVGPHEVCRFTLDGDEAAESGARKAGGLKAEGFQVTWRGCWNGDQWCPWLLERARALISASEST